MMRVVVGMICLLVMVSAAMADTITSDHWRVVDGDTIHIDDYKIRLAGIDAPEIKQQCQNPSREKYPCSVVARDVLVSLLMDKVTCFISGKDRYGRYIGTCFSARIDVQKFLVRHGWAVAEYGDQYLYDEMLAKNRGAGIWAGHFTRPKEWRKQK